MAKDRQPLVPQQSSPRGQHGLGSTAHPALATVLPGCTGAAELEQLDRWGPASETKVSKPAATLSDRQDLGTGIGEGGDEGGHGKPVRQAMADKQKVQKHKGKKKIRTCKTVSDLRKRKWSKTRWENVMACSLFQLPGTMQTLSVTWQRLFQKLFFFKLQLNSVFAFESFS